VAKLAAGVTGEVDNIGNAAGGSLGRLGALVAAGLSIGTALVPAAASAAFAVGYIGTAALAAASGVGVLVLGFSGVIQGVTALNKYTQDVAKSNKSLSASQTSIMSAENSLQSAEESLSNARRTAATQAQQAQRRIVEAVQAEADARKAASDAVKQAIRDENSAEKELTSAQRDATQAREALTQAYDDAIQRLAQLRRNERDNTLDQRQAVLDLKKAKEDLDKITSNPRATRDEIEQARISYEQRVNQLDDLKDRQQQLATEQAKADKQGIEGSQEVKNARQRIADADQRVADAQQRVADAQTKVLDAMVEGQKRIAKAEQNVSDARQAAADQQIQSQQQIEAAARGVEQAQRGVTQAIVNSGVAGGAALNNLKTAFGGLSPEAQRFVRYVVSLKDAALGVRQAAERGMLPGFQAALRDLLPYLPAVSGFVEKIGEALGSMAQQAVLALRNPAWQQFFSFIDATAVPMLKQMFTVAEALARGVGSLVVNLSAFNRPIGQGLVNLAEGFATWAESLDRSAGFHEFLQFAARTGPLVVDVLKQLATFAFRFVEAAAPIGVVVLGAFDGLLKLLNAIPIPVLTAAVAVIGLFSVALLANTGYIALRSSVIALSTNLTLLWTKAQAGLNVVTTAFSTAAGAASENAGFFGRALAVVKSGAQGVSTGIGNLASSIGPGSVFGAAVIAATVIIGGLISQHEKHKAAVEGMKDSLLQLSDAYQQMGKGGGDFLKTLVAQNEGLRNLVINGQRYGVTVGEVVSAVNGDHDARTRVTAAYDKQIKSLNDLLEKQKNGKATSEDYAAAGAKEGDDIVDLIHKREADREALGKAIDAKQDATKATNLLTDAEKANASDGFTNSIHDLQTALSGTNPTMEQFQAAISGIGSIAADTETKAGTLAVVVQKVADSNLTGAEKANLFDQALKGVGTSATTSGPTFDALAGIFTTIGNSAIDAHDKADLLRQAIDQMYGAARAQFDADEELVRSQSQLQTQLQTSSAGFDLTTAAAGTNTEQILSNVDALKQTLLAAQDVYFQDIAGGTAKDQATVKYQNTTKAIFDSIPPTQRSSDTVKELNDRFGQIPPEKKTDVSTPGIDKALDDLVVAHAVQIGLSQHPPWTRDQIASEVDYLKLAIDGRLGTNAVFKAEGGPVPGYSPSRSADNIPAWLTADEYVQPVDAVDYYGVGAMDLIRRRAIPRELFAHFAGGGPVIGNRDLTRWPIDIQSMVTIEPSLDQLWRQWQDARDAAMFGGGPLPASVAQNLAGWIAAAVQIAGVPANWAGGPGQVGLWTLVLRESGGNPRAINLTDENAQRGDPSRGLAQTIMGTFEAYRDPRLPDDIYDPVANLVAALRYIKARYGSIFNVQQADPSRPPMGYDDGGYLQPGWNPPIWNGTGQPEPVLNPGQWDAIERVASSRAAGGEKHYHFTFADTTLTPGRLRALQDREAALARVDRPR
jgi:hypothetical protein